MTDLSLDLLEPYLKVEEERSILSANEFTKDVLDYYLGGERITGVKLPFPHLADRFRLRVGEVTLLGGINGSGKSLFAGQLLLCAMMENKRCFSVSLEMSPKYQLARMWRQASLDVTPTLDYGLAFNAWASKRLWFLDKEGTIDMNHLHACMRYAVDNHGVEYILIDSLMTVSGIRHDDYTAQKELVCQLADIARDLEVHVILIAHARKGMSMKEKIDKWSIRGAGELTDRVDNVLLLGRYYRKDDYEAGADGYLSIAKARHFDGAEEDLDLYLDMASLNYYLPSDPPKKMELDDEVLDG